MDVRVGVCVCCESACALGCACLPYLSEALTAHLLVHDSPVKWQRL